MILPESESIDGGAIPQGYRISSKFLIENNGENGLENEKEYS